MHVISIVGNFLGTQPSVILSGYITKAFNILMVIHLPILSTPESSWADGFLVPFEVPISISDRHLGLVCFSASPRKASVEKAAEPTTY